MRSVSFSLSDSRKPEASFSSTAAGAGTGTTFCSATAIRSPLVS